VYLKLKRERGKERGWKKKRGGIEGREKRGSKWVESGEDEEECQQHSI
jgi:hypothetical protein